MTKPQLPTPHEHQIHVLIIGIAAIARLD